MPLSRRSTTTWLVACRIKIAWQKAPVPCLNFVMTIPHVRTSWWTNWRPHHPPEQRPIDQSDIGRCGVLVALPMISYIMQAAMVQLQGFNIYVSILDRWNYRERAATATRPIRRLEQQFAMAHGQFTTKNMSTPVFDIAQTVHQTILGVPASETNMNGSTGSTTVHCLPCAGNPSLGECPPHSPFSDHFFQRFGACLLPEIVHNFLGVDSLCCAGACSPFYLYPKYEPFCTS